MPIIQNEALTQAINSVTKPGTPVDWFQMLGVYGMPGPLVDKLQRMWKGAGPNPDMQRIIPEAFGIVRNSQWYANTFPGIQNGINTGLFQDERGYRAYQNDLTQLYRQYYKRPVTPTEMQKIVTSGKSVRQVGAELNAQAIRGNITDPLRKLFSQQELTAFANQQAGIDTEIGQRIAREADLALRVDDLYKDFYGRGVNRAELDSLTKSGTTADQVAKEFATQANINAMNPAISHLFSPEEIRQIALERAGGTTQQGQTLAAQASLAQQLNPLYHQYTGAGVSREDVARAYQTGESAERIGQRFAGQAYVQANRGDIQQVAGSFGGTGQGLSEDELQSLGEQNAGYDSAVGQRLQNALEKAQRRFQRVSQGVLSNPTLALLNGRPASSRRGPDTAA